MAPKRKPNSLKATGSKHARNVAPVVLGESNPPRVPGWVVCKESRKMYRRLAKDLHSLGLIRANTVDLLAVYAGLIVKIQQQQINGEEVKPSMLTQLRTLANDLLITESSRIKLGIEPSGKSSGKWEDNPFAEI
jgi:hypothetical protein